ncbi:MAG: hypothetical protein LC659_09770 [Myxococcales bacterium]|nr:hypothetical protein [Myxococcales bacterium]
MTRAVGLFVGCLVLFAWGLHYVGSGDTIPAEQLPIAVLRDHSLRFDRIAVERPLPYYFVEKNGHVSATSPILPGLLNLPAHAVARLFAVDAEAHVRDLAMITAAVIAAASVAVLYLVLLRAFGDGRRALGFALAYAFGTTVFSVACRGLWQHGPSLLFINLALLGLFSDDNRRVAWAGLFVGLAVAARYPNFIALSPLALYVAFERRRALLPFLALAALPVAGVLLHSWWALGSPFEFIRVYGGGDETYPRRFWTGLTGILVSPNRGLFVFSPMFLLSAAGVRLAWRRPGLYRYASLTIPLTLIVMASHPMWWGGWSFGYRMLADLVPFLTVLMALAWPLIADRRPLRIAFYGTVALSVYFNFLGAWFYPTAYSWFPESIDRNPARLWSVRHSELGACTKQLWLHLRGRH